MTEAGVPPDACGAYWYQEGHNPHMLMGAVTGMHPYHVAYDKFIAEKGSVDVLATSYENRTVEECFEREAVFEGKNKVFVVLRDLRNWVATIFIRRNGDFHLCVDTWKEHVKQARTNPDVFPISYNAWFSSKDYRKFICTYLDVPFSDDGLNDVKWTSHSCQGNAEWHGQAQAKLKVLDRWRTVWNKKEYRKFLESDTEALELNEKEFGQYYD
jgi:hypothetical protein